MHKLKALRLFSHSHVTQQTRRFQVDRISKLKNTKPSKKGNMKDGKAHKAGSAKVCQFINSWVLATSLYFIVHVSLHS